MTLTESTQPSAARPAPYPVANAPLVWAQLQKLVDSEPSRLAYFGSGVAIHGDTAPLGDVPRSSCAGHLCDGLFRGCPAGCGGDTECTDSHYCKDAERCNPKAPDGAVCLANNTCLSGHCVDALCCAEACDEGCGSCVATGREGICTPLEAGQPGTPSCNGHQECSLGNYCDAGACLPHGGQGAACADNNACGTGYCTDSLCCIAEACGAYRCGPAGACEAACSSSVQCARAHQCSSVGKCESIATSPAGNTESGGCHLKGVAAQPVRPLDAFGALGMVAYLAATRKRRPKERRPRQG